MNELEQATQVVKIQKESLLKSYQELKKVIEDPFEIDMRFTSYDYKKSDDDIRMEQEVSFEENHYSLFNKPLFPLELHLQLSKRIVGDINRLSVKQHYRHNKAINILRLVLINVEKYYPPDDDLILLLNRLIGRNNKIDSDDFTYVLSLLDTDYEFYPEFVYRAYGDIYNVNSSLSHSLR